MPTQTPLEAGGCTPQTTHQAATRSKHCGFMCQGHMYTAQGSCKVEQARDNTSRGSNHMYMPWLRPCKATATDTAPGAEDGGTLYLTSAAHAGFAPTSNTASTAVSVMAQSAVIIHIEYTQAQHHGTAPE